MIDKTLHWDAELRQNQQELLESLDPQRREWVAYMLRTGNASMYYYKEQQAEPTEEDFQEWLEGLPENIASDFRESGYESSRGALPLRRYAAEKNDLGLDAYMKQALLPKDYDRWMEQKKASLVQ